MSWSNLPTNYVDATWEGDRKYTIDLKVSGGRYENATIDDTTSYNQPQSGTYFYGANDANQTNDAINKIVAALGDDINNLKVNIGNGGTGATTSQNACINLGLGTSSTNDFSANDYNSWISQTLNYVDSNVSERRPFVFHAGWQGIGYGSGIAFKTSDNYKFAMINNQNGGVSFWGKDTLNNDWGEIGISGNTLYDNSSGTNGTVDLGNGTNVNSYKYLDIFYKHATTGTFSAERISPSYDHDWQLKFMWYSSTDGYMVFNTKRIVANGRYITNDSVGYGNFKDSNNVSVRIENDLYITKVVGYK